MLQYFYRVVKTREVLQNGMSFANEKVNALRCFYASAIFLISKGLLVNYIGLSILLWEIFLMNFLKNLVFSPILEGKTNTQKIAYIGVVTALLVASNMFFEFKLASVQFSLTLFFSAVAGVLLGSTFGFCACIIGDLIGFLYNSGGFAYMPWIGLAMGMVAFIFGAVINGINLKIKGEEYIKISIACALTFLVCTVGINTTALWLTYSKGVSFIDYAVNRIFILGQIWNSLLNYALVFILYPILIRVKLINKNNEKA